MQASSLDLDAIIEFSSKNDKPTVIKALQNWDKHNLEGKYKNIEDTNCPKSKGYFLKIR